MHEAFDIAQKIALAALLGGAVGAEREWTGKLAGLRTHMLMAVGSALLTDLSIGIGPLFAAGSAAWDPGRIAAQIVSGVGFICAGTIIQSRAAVHGLTTAAGLWVASAVGMAVGAAFYVEAVMGTSALLLILALLKPVERFLFRNRQTVTVEVDAEHSTSDVLSLFEEAGIEPLQVRLAQRGQRRDLVVDFQGGQGLVVRLQALAARKGMVCRPGS